jgi:hypothetical protein
VTCTHPGWRTAPWERCAACGERKPVSPSEHSTARGCLRKWAYRYASPTPKAPDKASAATGKELHTTQEAYLRDGVTPPATGLGLLARAGLPFLPAPGTMDVEAPFHTVIDGIPFFGFKDFRGLAADLLGFPAGAHRAVGDHKTSKDPKKYGIWSMADRLDDTQSLVYAHDEPGDQPVGLRWLYYPTQGRAKPKPSDHILTRREIRGGLERVVLPLAEKIYRLRDGKQLDPLDIPPNAAHCNDFGGCDYGPRGLNTCNVTGAQTIASYFGGTGKEGFDMSNLWDQLQAKGGHTTADGVNGAPVTAAPAAAAAQPAPGFAFSFAPAVPAPVTPAPDPVPAPVTPAPAPAFLGVASEAPQAELIAVASDARAIVAILCAELGAALLRASTRLD